MDEQYIKDVLETTTETWSGRKVPISISVPEDLAVAFKEICGKTPYSVVTCKLISDFVTAHQKLKSR